MKELTGLAREMAMQMERADNLASQLDFARKKAREPQTVVFWKSIEAYEPRMSHAPLWAYTTDGEVVLVSYRKTASAKKAEFFRYRSGDTICGVTWWAEFIKPEPPKSVPKATPEEGNNGST